MKKIFLILRKTNENKIQTGTQLKLSISQKRSNFVENFFPFVLYYYQLLWLKISIFYLVPLVLELWVNFIKFLQ